MGGGGSLPRQPQGIVTESILGPTTNVTSASGFADTFSVPLSDNYSDPFAGKYVLWRKVYSLHILRKV